MLCLLLAAALTAGHGNAAVANSASSRIDAPGSASSSYVATAHIGTQPGRAIPPTFMGISMEWGQAQTILGSTATGINLPFRQMLKNLTAYGSGPMILRIGGNSTDQTTVPERSTVEPFAELAKDMNVHFFLGVNLAVNDPTLAAEQARNYLEHMPQGSVVALEIGNEPENYPGHKQRAANFTTADYMKDFATWEHAIARAVPAGTRFMGPSWSYLPMLDDTKNISAFLKEDNASLGIFSEHFYVGTDCEGKKVAYDFLLTPMASTLGAKIVANAVALTHNAHLTFRVDEMNSVSCGGQQRVSDSFSSALWALDTMFEYANAGVDGVNLHTGNGGPYALFRFAIAKGGQGLNAYSAAKIAPAYYGMLVFQQASGHNASLLPVTLNTTANMKVWATVDSTGTVKAVVINKDKTAGGKVALTLPGFKSATVVRLTAPGWQATSDVKLAGQSFNEDATLTGTKSMETVTGTRDTYVFDVPVTSAALLTFSR